MAQMAVPGLLTDFPRLTNHKTGLAKLYSGYSNCTLEVFEQDFTLGLPETVILKDADNASISRYITPEELGSFVLNFDTRAEIFINSAKRNGSDEPILNRCYRRFLLMKELFHIVLRDEFLRHKVDHPDTNSPELLISLLERLIYLPFSVLDFDNPEYQDATKVEHAAELFATLSMYPMERVAADRKEFLESIGADTMEDGIAKASSSFHYANQYRVPRRYVDLLFRWDRFDELYSNYRQFSQGY